MSGLWGSENAQGVSPRPRDAVFGLGSKTVSTGVMKRYPSRGKVSI